MQDTEGEFLNGDIIVGDFLDVIKKGIAIAKDIKSVSELSSQANSIVVLKNDNRIYIGGFKDGKYHGENTVWLEG